MRADAYLGTMLDENAWCCMAQLLYTGADQMVESKRLAAGLGKPRHQDVLGDFLMWLGSEKSLPQTVGRMGMLS